MVVLPAVRSGDAPTLRVGERQAVGVSVHGRGGAVVEVGDRSPVAGGEGAVERRIAPHERGEGGELRALGLRFGQGEVERRGGGAAGIVLAEDLETAPRRGGESRVNVQRDRL